MMKKLMSINVDTKGNSRTEAWPEDWYENPDYVERLAWSCRNGIAYCKLMKALEREAG